MLDNQFMTISEIMSKKPISVESGSTIEQTAQIMAKYHVGTLVVLESEKLIGIVSVENIVYNVIAQKKDPKEISVNDVMNTKYTTISPDKDVKEAIEIMNEYEVRILPVMVGDKLVGYVTRKDIIRIEPTLIDIAVESIRTEEQRRQQKIEKIASSGEFFDVDDLAEPDDEDED